MSDDLPGATTQPAFPRRDISRLAPPNDIPFHCSNARTSEYSESVNIGVLVPSRIARFALQCAPPVARLLLTMDAAVVDLKESNAAALAGAGMDD